MAEKGAPGQPAPQELVDSFQQIFDAFFDPHAPGKDRRVELPLSLIEASEGCRKPLRYARSVRCDRCKGDGGEPGSATHPCYRCGGKGQRATEVGEDGTAQVVTCDRCKGTKVIHLVPCAYCQGRKLVERQKELTIRVPPGVETGHQLRLNGQGDESPGKGPAGSLLLVVVVATHPRLRREGADIHVQVQIDPETAENGGRVTVPTLSGERTIEVPKGTTSGARLVLPGHGAVRFGAEPVPIPEGPLDPYRVIDVSEHRGDQVVTFEVRALPAPIQDENEDGARRDGKQVVWAVGLSIALVAGALLAMVAGR
jgi:molecular chaperone DnaJ